jgi:hypothetical protein
MWLVLCSAYLSSYLCRVCIIFFYYTTSRSTLSSYSPLHFFCILPLFSRVPTVNNQLHVANHRSIRRRDHTFRSLFRTRETQGSNIHWKILTDFWFIWSASLLMQSCYMRLKQGYAFNTFFYQCVVHTGTLAL